MKLKIILNFFLFYSILIICAVDYYNVNGLPKEISDNLYGVWVKDLNNANFYTDKFSWGYSHVDPINGFILFDFSKSKQFLDIQSDLGGALTILDSKKINPKSYLIFIESKELSDKQKQIIITFLNDRTIEIKPNSIFFMKGTFYKSGGPDILYNDYYMPNVINLELKKNNFIESETLKILKSDEKVVILDNLKDQKNLFNDKTKTYWIYIETLDGLKGYCLDNQLKKFNIFYEPSINSLRFRESPSLYGKIIRNLNKCEKLELIEKGKEETINGVKGSWVKVKTEKGEVGWCFDAYLEEVK
ncbi:MAG: SH3 domain-containing protein [Ignavibacteriales bacterium]|nr:SH3 domain-containing protein [Ignavibacteriales bacterium]